MGTPRRSLPPELSGEWGGLGCGQTDDELATKTYRRGYAPGLLLALNYGASDSADSVCFQGFDQLLIPNDEELVDFEDDWIAGRGDRVHGRRPAKDEGSQRRVR